MKLLYIHIDEDYKNILKGDKWLHKYAREPSDPKYHNFAGEYLIIFDKI